MKELGYLMDANIMGDLFKCPKCGVLIKGRFMPMKEIKSVVSERNMQPYTVYADWFDIACECGFLGYSICDITFAKEYFASRSAPEQEAEK